MEITIGGHVYETVDLATLAGRDSYARYLAIGEAIPDPISDYDKMTKYLTLVVTKWDWPGEPTDPAAWDVVPHYHRVRLAAQTVQAVKN